MKKKVLIIYAPYGSGHKSVANYIGNYFSENNAEFEIKVLDIAKYANMFGKVSIRAFDFVIKHRTNHLFSFVYDAANNRVASLSQMQIVKKAFDNSKIRKEIIDFNPDLTISTHFFGGNIISFYNEKGLTHSKIMTVITDYASHSFWRKDHQVQDAYIVANELVKNELVKKGIVEDKIYAFGIPFDRKKQENIKTKDDTICKYGIDPTKKTYLFFAGGSSGSMINYEYLKALIKKQLPINIIFICGNNQKLEDKCRSYIVKNKIQNVKIQGFVKDVYSLLNISDAVITKPGGATITECIDMRVPMILIPGNGGPEKYNARFVCKNKYGIKTKNIFNLCRIVTKTVKNEKILLNYKENLNKLEKNESTKKIYELSVKLLKKS